MKNIKKSLATIMALTMIASLASCNNSSDPAQGDTPTGETTVETAATTTAKTVAEVNTETLQADEQEVFQGIMDGMKDVELENKTVKWLGHYDINPNLETGASKSIQLELFEQKYGGKVEFTPTTWDTRYADLSTKVLGGEGIDIFPGEDNPLPKGVLNGMFQPIDDYINLDDAVWDNTREAMKNYNFAGKHYELIYDVESEYLCIYNKATIDANAMEDPWDLYKAGEWNWDTFKDMLIDFVDVDADQHGLDGFWAEKALLASAGTPAIGTADGKLVSNIGTPEMEKAMNYQYDLFTNGLIFDRAAYNYTEQPAMMGEGKQLFYIVGTYAIAKDPATWVVEIPAEDVGIVPVPSPAGSDNWQSAKPLGYVLCKGAQNPEGAALLTECGAVAAMDDGATEIGKRKALDDYNWSEEIYEKATEIKNLSRQYPMIEFASGASTDIASVTTEGGDNIGIRAAMHGTDWATMRDTIKAPIDAALAEINDQLAAVE